MFYVRNDEVQNGLGQAIPNIAVTYYVEPGLTLATCYSDSGGGTTVPNPQYTNGLGQTAVWLAPGLYTITYSGAQIQTLTFINQLVSAGGTSSNPYTPTPAPNGATRIFTLLSAPAVAADVQLFLAGSFVPYGGQFTISGNTITWIGAVPPQTGDSLVCFF
jgi:hypothetical protein